MPNYPKQHSDVFCTGQTSILGSEGHAQPNTRLYHSEVRVSPYLIPKTREFKYFRTSIHSLENEIQIEE